MKVKVIGSEMRSQIQLAPHVMSIWKNRAPTIPKKPPIEAATRVWMSDDSSNLDITHPPSLGLESR